MADPLEEYEMLEELGSGSFGVVYKAVEKATGELVAIKHIDLDGTDDDIRDIQQEISLLSTCSSPYVTKYKTSFVRGVKLWIVMEYLGGGSCLDLLRAQPFSEAHVAIICRELLLGLDYLHATGKIHRDIKAANILLSHTGKVKIADFGVAAQLTNIKSQRNTFVGTPFWMAPEVIQEAGYDFRADIWSLGITTMELIQGEPPNAELHPMKALFHIPKNPPPRLDNNRYSREIRSFVACCLVKDPTRRPSARDLLQHRFIQKAGSMDSLRQLIEASQQHGYAEDDDHHPRFYEETLKSMPRRDAEANDDDWVFDTVKPAAKPVPYHTMKKRKISETAAAALEPPTQMMESLDLDRAGRMVDQEALARSKVMPTPSPQATMMRVPRRRESVQASPRKVSSPSKHQTPTGSPSKHTPSVSPMKALSPLKPSTTFEIAQSPTRQSSTSSVLRSPTRQSSASSVVHSPRKIAYPSRRTSTKQPLAPDTSFGNGQSPTKHTRQISDQSIDSSYISSCTTLVTNENLPPPEQTSETPPTKEARLGHRIFSKVIDPAFQEVYAHTPGRAEQDHLARAGEAWAALDGLDPEIELVLFKLMLEKVQADPKLSRALLPAQHLSSVPQQLERRHSAMPAQLPAGSSPATPGQPKLLLAQNNPHLKSHKRRQSSQVSLISAAAEKAQLPGQSQTGMEHVKVMSDALYGRWLEGLRARWPQA